MARARNIKPSIFKNEILGVADPILTILFAALWCLADREGYLEDRPLRIKAEALPYRENLDINGYLTELAQLGFIRRFTGSDGTPLIHITKFLEHQNPHKTERPSEYTNLDIPSTCLLTVKEPLINGETTEVAGLIPDSLLLIPDSRIKEASLRSGKKTKPPTKMELRYAKKGFSPEIVDLGFAIVAITPAKDPVGENRKITCDMSLLCKRLEHILGMGEGWTGEVLLHAYQDYLIGRDQWIKAPQYFFSMIPLKGEEDPFWLTYAMGVITQNSRQRPLPSSKTTPALLCPQETVSDEPSHGPAQPRGQNDGD